MKHISFIVIALFLIAGTTWASSIIRVNERFASVNNGYQVTDVYRLVDTEYNTVCYFSYRSGSSNMNPAIDCVSASSSKSY